MSLLAALVLAAPAPPLPAGVRAVAHVSVEIVQPVGVRQGEGLVSGDTVPAHQFSQRDGIVLVEFE